MTCDQVRELLPEQLLGTLEGPEELEVRRHLRGCAACRAERAKLEDGVAAYAHAMHDIDPPPELRSRVLGTLVQEWNEPVVSVDDAARSSTKRRVRFQWLAAAAAVFIIVGALAFWGGAQTRRANEAVADASSYQNLLHTLGGKDFRVGTLQPQNDSEVYGRVMLYDGDTTSAWSSWGVVLLNTTASTKGMTAALTTPDGQEIDLLPPHATSEKSAVTWLSTDQDLTPYDHLTIKGSDGTVLATAVISPA